MRTFLTVTLSALLLGAGAVTLAGAQQPAAQPTSAAATAAPSAATERRAQMRERLAQCEQGRGKAQGGRQRGADRGVKILAEIRDNPSLAVVYDLRAIERLYRRQNREAELPEFLRGQLTKTGDTTVRTYIHHRLAQIAARSGDEQVALSQLTQSLNENLGKLR